MSIMEQKMDEQIDAGLYERETCYNRIAELESQLKEKGVIIRDYHTKMVADKESYFEVVEAHDDLQSQLKEVKEENEMLKKKKGDSKILIRNLRKSKN